MVSGYWSPAWGSVCCGDGGSETASVLSRFVAGPVQLLILVLFLSLARRPLQLSLTVSRMLDALEQILLIIAITWTILRVVESFEAIVRSQALRRDKAILLPLLPVVRKSLKILIATFAGLAVLHSFGVNVITVLAGLGVGGIAVALAAQKTLENFIGGITVYADQPVRVGEFCRFGGTVGTVEEVGLRSTRVRTLDRTVVTIPNSEFSNLQIENFARRDRIWYHPTIRLRYETTPDQIRYVSGRGASDALCAPEGRLDLGPHPVRRLRQLLAGSRGVQLRHRDRLRRVPGGRRGPQLADHGHRRRGGLQLCLAVADDVSREGPWARSRPCPGGEAQVQEWRERRELWLPRFPREKIAEIDNTLQYPADGSATGTEGGRR